MLSTPAYAGADRQYQREPPHAAAGRAPASTATATANELQAIPGFASRLPRCKAAGGSPKSNDKDKRLTVNLRYNLGTTVVCRALSLQTISVKLETYVFLRIDYMGETSNKLRARIEHRTQNA